MKRKIIIFLQQQPMACETASDNLVINKKNVFFFTRYHTYQENVITIIPWA